MRDVSQEATLRMQRAMLASRAFVLADDLEGPRPLNAEDGLFVNAEALHMDSDIAGEAVEAVEKAQAAAEEGGDGLGQEKLTMEWRESEEGTAAKRAVPAELVAHRVRERRRALEDRMRQRVNIYAPTPEVDEGPEAEAAEGPSFGAAFLAGKGGFDPSAAAVQAQEEADADDADDADAGGLAAAAKAAAEAEARQAAAQAAAAKAVAEAEAKRVAAAQAAATAQAEAEAQAAAAQAQAAAEADVAQPKAAEAPGAGSGEGAA